MIPAYAVSSNLLGFFPDREVERLCRQASIAKLLGASVFRFDASFKAYRKPDFTWEDGIKEMAPRIRRIAEFGSKIGVKTCTENHGFLYQAPERMKKLIEAVGHENYGWLVDIGNFSVVDRDNLEAVKIAAPYDTGCKYGCLGKGDCEAACKFDAIHVDPVKGIAVVDEDKCTACGSCVKACPKGIIELRNKGFKNRRVYVSCINKDKGAVARKACGAACIGCGKCAKTCPFDAITVENNVAYIDFTKCKMCRKCVEVCPTGAIHEVNFPPKPKIEEKPHEENV